LPLSPAKTFADIGAGSGWFTVRAARRVTGGDVEILDAFWDPHLTTGAHDVVPPILAYADLMTTTDARNLEAAKLIYEQLIAPNLPTA
jgi:hypothetical protein